jgi:hypothetical protein
MLRQNSFFYMENTIDVIIVVVGVLMNLYHDRSATSQSVMV